MKKSNFALRLQPSLMEEARKVAKAEGVAVNQLINVAVAEKASALRTEEYFAERAARGDLKKALHVLKRAGKAIHLFPVTNYLRRSLAAGVDPACTRRNQARSPLRQNQSRDRCARTRRFPRR
jgi:hypothetical protein